MDNSFKTFWTGEIQIERGTLMLSFFRKARSRWNVFFFILICLYWISFGLITTSLFIDCENGHKWIAHFLFVIIISIFSCLHFCTMKIMKSEDIAQNGGSNYFEGSRLNKFKFAILQYILAHADIYTDLCFIQIVHDTDAFWLFLISSFLFGVSCLLKFYVFVRWIIYLCIGKKFESIEIFQNFNWNEFIGISWLIRLDIQAIYSVQNDFHMFFLKFFAEDFFQLIFQIIYNAGEYCSKGKSIILLILSILISFSSMLVNVTLTFDKYKKRCKADEFLSGSNLIAFRTGDRIFNITGQEVESIGESLKMASKSRKSERFRNTNGRCRKIYYFFKDNLNLSFKFNLEKQTILHLDHVTIASFPQAWKNLAKGIRFFGRFVTLIFDNCEMNEEDIIEIAKAAVENPDLESITFTFQQIEVTALQIIDDIFGFHEFRVRGNLPVFQFASVSNSIENYNFKWIRVQVLDEGIFIQTNVTGERILRRQTMQNSTNQV